MSQPLSDAFDNPYVAIVVVAVILVAVISYRIYLIRNPGFMRVRCPKCKEVFDGGRCFSGIHIGPIKQLRCPACDKTSFMTTYVKDPITWANPEQKEQAQTLTDEELEGKQIEESKYEQT